MKTWLRIVGWIVIGVTTIFFVQNGIQKLAGTEQMVDMFYELGYRDLGRVVVGLIEVAGGILLLFPRWTIYAAGSLGILMIGAIVTEVINNHSFEAVLAGQWLIVLATIAGVRFRLITQMKTKERTFHE